MSGHTGACVRGCVVANGGVHFIIDESATQVSRKKLLLEHLAMRNLKGGGSAAAGGKEDGTPARHLRHRELDDILR